MQLKGRRVPGRFNRVAILAFNSFGNGPGLNIAAPHRLFELRPKKTGLAPPGSAHPKRYTDTGL